LTDTTNTATDQTEADIGSGVEQNVQRETASSLARLLREVIALVSRKSIDGRSEFAAVVHLVRLAAKNVRNRLLIVASAEVRQNPDRVNSGRKVKSSAYSVATLSCLYRVISGLCDRLRNSVVGLRQNIEKPGARISRVACRIVTATAARLFRGISPTRGNARCGRPTHKRVSRPHLAVILAAQVTPELGRQGHKYSYLK